MSFIQIRGQQIQDGVIGNNHINPSAPIQESNLAINWHNHTEALADRKIVIPVQVNAVTLTNGTSMDITNKVTGNVAVTTVGTAEGIITDAPNNKVAIRNLDDTLVYVNVSGADYELYGRITYVGGATPVWTLSYFYVNGSGTETAYTFTQAATPLSYILFIPKRQNLLTMDEMVLAGYRFMVQDAVDAVTGANTHQLAADLYGPNYSLTGNGVTKLSRSVVAEIQYQTSGVVNTGVRANTIIDEIITARGAFPNINGRFANNENNITTVTTQSNADHAEIVAARSDAATTPVVYANLKARLDHIDSQISTVSGGGSTTQTEVTAARTTTVAQQTGAYYAAADLKTRLSDDFAAVLAKITQEVTDRTTAINALGANLANSTDNTKGAALVGVKSAKLTSSSNVLAALDALYDLAHGTGANTGVSASNTIDEVIAARSDGAATPNVYANLKARLDHIDTVAAAETTRATAAEVALQGRATALETEVTAARGTKSSVTARLDVAINSDGTLKAGTTIHTHKKFVYQAVGGETSVSLTGGNKFQAGDDSLDVYVNGTLQSKGLHYTEITPATPDGTGTGISFGSTTLVAGDVVVLKYYLNNAS